MPDYSLGRAHGKIEIDYDGSGAGKAAKDLDAVAESSTKADKSLDKTQKTISDTSREMDSAGSAADGYSRRLKDVEEASAAADAAEKRHRATLLDARATLDDIKDAEDEATEARKRHTRAIEAERDAHKALSGATGASAGALSGLMNLLPDFHAKLSGIASGGADASKSVDELTGKTSGLASALGTAAKAALALGQPEIAAPLAGLAAGVDSVSSAAGRLGDAVKTVAGFEAAFAKIGGLTLAMPSLGGLAGLGGAAGAQGVVELAGAAKQLSGVLGLLPATVGGVAAVMGTLQVALHGVGDALSDMMADDPTKFLEDIKNMAPAAAQSLMQVAQFRDQFFAAGGAVQQSFFARVAADIAPLIQTWLPALTQAGSQIADVLGGAADNLAGLLQQPGAMAAFGQFINNVSSGLQAMQPAMAPLLNVLAQLSVVGSSFFAQIGDKIVLLADGLNSIVSKANASGALQSWIQDGINAFGHLIDIVSNLGSSFLNIMDIADKFGGGGLLGWLEQLSGELDKWTTSAGGQQALTDFFSTLRKAADAFTPMLGPLLNGLASIGTAFVNLGIGIAPGFQTFFDTFASSMAQLAPHIAAMAPGLNTFLTGMAKAFGDLMAQVGPQLPKIFQDLANAFVALLPQIGPLVDAFIQIVNQVGPQLPKLFGDITELLTAMVPLIQPAVGALRLFVSALSFVVETGTGVVNAVSTINQALGVKLPQVIRGAWESIKEFPQKALQWGKDLVSGFINGISSMAGELIDAVKKHITDPLPNFVREALGIHSPSRVFHDIGLYMMQGLQQGIAAGGGAVLATAAGIVGQVATQSRAGVAGAAGGGLGAGAPAGPGGGEGLGGSLLPPWIAGADNSILSAYLRHEFSDTNGLKGLSKDIGQILSAAQSGFSLISQNLGGTLFQALGMVPGLAAKPWQKMSPAEMTAQQQADLQKKAAGAAPKGPSWSDVTGNGTAWPGQSVPLGLSASSSKADIQKAIIAAGKARGLDDSAIQTALATAAAESGFNPTISGGVQGSAGLVSGLYQQSPSSGWGTLDQVNDPNHAINAFYDAFAKQLAKNPTNPQLAAVLTQNPQLGSAAQGSDYWNAIGNQLGLANSIMGAYGNDIKGPSWQQITAPPAGIPGTAAATGAASADYKNWYPAGGTEYGLPKGTDTGGYGTGNASTFPAWVMALADQFGVKPSTYSGHQETDRNEPGYAPNPNHENRGIDWAGSVDNMQRFAEALAQAAPNLPGLEQIIWQNPNTGQKIGLGGADNLDPSYYPQSTYDEHGNHVHTRQSTPLILGGTGIGNSVLAGANGGDMVLANGKTVDQLTDSTTKSATANDQLLQAYLRGNPQLAAQIDAAKTPGATDDTMLGALTGIDSTIASLKSQDAVANKNTIDALQSTQNQIAQTGGFQQGQGAVQQASSIASNIGGAVTSVFQAIQGGLDAVTATQDIADRLVYGVRNTEDINVLIDDVQKYITFAANVASSVGAILSAVGAIGGASGGMDMGASSAVSAAGSIAQLVAGALQGVNMAIDFGQQIYHIAGTYVGRLLSQMTAGLTGTPLMGDVRMLLNKNTGQLLTYSEDNPGNKNTLNVPSFLNGALGYGGGNQNPQTNNQWNIYAGPGQSPGEMLNETMWMVNTAGTTGAMAAANF